jgi:NitT/TauT family transport system ATP-binding protein
VIDLIGVRKTFAGRQTALLDGVDLHLSAGETFGLIGPGACGKSVLLKILCRLLTPDAGKVAVADVKIGMLFQNNALFDFMTIAQNVAFPLERDGVLGSDEIDWRVKDKLRAVGLAGSEDKFPNQLSGGMRKRAALIRTLVYDPPVILMDEPFGALDAQTRTQLQADLLRLWNLGRKTIIFVTHDIGEAIALGDRTLVLSRPPSRVAGEHAITIPRPREVRDIMSHPDFAPLYQRIRAQVQ